MDGDKKRRHPIGEDDVRSVANRLLLSRQRPTIDRIRRELGGGSPNTVAKYLDAWFFGLADGIKEPGSFSPLAGVPDSIQEAAKFLWDRACAGAHETIGAQFKQRAQELAAAQDELAKERQTMQAQSEGLERALAESAARAREAAETIARMQSALDARAEEVALLAQAADQQRREFAAAEERHAAERSAFDAERAALAEQSAAAGRRAAIEIDRARDDARQWRARLDKAEVAIAQAQAARTQLVESHARDATSWTAERARLSQALAESQARADAADAQLAAAAERVETFGSLINSLQTKLQDAFDSQAARDAAHTALLQSLVPSAKLPRPRPRK